MKLTFLSSPNGILFDPALYQERRTALMKLMPKDSIGIVFSAPTDKRYFPYLPDNNLIFLSGLDAPNVALVLIPSEQKTVLYRQYADSNKRLWDGEQLKDEVLVEMLPGCEIRPYQHLSADINALNKQHERLYLPLSDEHPQLKLTKSMLGINYKEVRDLNSLLFQQRSIKCHAERYQIRVACNIAAQAFIHTISKCSPAMKERQLALEFELHSKRHDATGLAFHTIAATGRNATVLHYNALDSVLREGELVLLDAGCVFAGYRSDISRTFPVSGKFTQLQKNLYNLVLEVQRVAIAAVEPGITWHKLEQIAAEAMLEGLAQLRLVRGSTRQMLTYGLHKNFMPHSVGHWLGLDTHDCKGVEAEFAEGHILTVEPGIYIRKELFERAEPFINYDLLKHYQGIGIRIEDDILVTSSGHAVLTEMTPKSVTDIEQLMKKKSPLKA